MESEALDDDELDSLELLRRTRRQLELPEASQVAARDPKTRAAARRFLDQERTGVVDDTSKQYDDDMRLVILGLMRVAFEAQKRDRAL